MSATTCGVVTTTYSKHVRAHPRLCNVACANTLTSFNGMSITNTMYRYTFTGEIMSAHGGGHRRAIELVRPDVRQAQITCLAPLAKKD